MPLLVAGVNGRSLLRPTRPNSPKVGVAGSSERVYARVFDKGNEFGKTSVYKLDNERSDSRYYLSVRMLARVPNNQILPFSITVKYAATRRLQRAHAMFLLHHCFLASYFGKSFKNFAVR